MRTVWVVSVLIGFTTILVANALARLLHSRTSLIGFDLLAIVVVASILLVRAISSLKGNT